MTSFSVRGAATAALLVGALASSCGSSGQGGNKNSAPAAPAARTFTISAVPDQDPEKLQRLYSKVASYLSKELGVKVEYKPVTDYTASVNLFRAGDLDMVWFGGLTGVQARLQVPGAQAIIQRDVDEAFRSVFIVNTTTGIGNIDSVSGLSVLRGRRFTFGSESSTSGRLMPEYFLDQAGVQPSDFKGEPGFSGSHDKTIALVEAGTFEAGAVNEQVWSSRIQGGDVDPSRVTAVFTSPPYHDYHWVISPEAASRYGADFVGKVKRSFTDLRTDDPVGRQILDLFAAKRFIPTTNDNYRQIEEIGRKRSLIS